MNPELSVWHNFVCLIGHITFATLAGAFVWNFAVIPCGRWAVQQYQREMIRHWTRESRIYFFAPVRPLSLDR